MSDSRGSLLCRGSVLAVMTRREAVGTLHVTRRFCFVPLLLPTWYLLVAADRRPTLASRNTRAPRQLKKMMAMKRPLAVST